ncbi:unnamed protein product, partial [Linum tenue]
YYFGDHYITTRPWQKGFTPRTNSIDSTLVWIQFPDLPIELYHPEAVLRIASKVGKPIRVDRATETGARAKFARVCIEADLTKPLVTQFKVAGVEYDIQYEGLTNICFHCGKYGHPQTRCPALHATPEEPKTPDQSSQRKPRHEEPYGEWMIAKRRERRPHPRNESVNNFKQGHKIREGDMNMVGGSRFAALYVEEEQEAEAVERRNMLESQGNKEGDKQQRPQMSKQVWVEKLRRDAGDSNNSQSIPDPHRNEKPNCEEVHPSANCPDATNPHHAAGQNAMGAMRAATPINNYPNLEPSTSQPQTYISNQMVHEKQVEEMGRPPDKSKRNSMDTLAENLSNKLEQPIDVLERQKEGGVNNPSKDTEMESQVAGALPGSP